MRALLDTHALIWWLTDSPSLSSAAHDALADPSNAIYVSAASACEIATKHRIGKLPRVNDLAGEIGRILARERVFELPISVRHGERAGEHRDPLDRMLLAQALAENLTLVSNERLFDPFRVSRLW